MLQDKITQKKLDAIGARWLHEQRLALLKRKSRFVDVLAVTVPAIYFPIRLLSKGTTVGVYVETVWAVAAGVLAAASFYKLVLKWQDAAEQHSKMIGENISMVTQADYLLSNPDTLTADKAQLFFLLSDALEKTDRGALGSVKPKEKQEAYREALKESVPHSVDIKCDFCNASPWRYKPGSCQACGNTPEKELNKEAGHEQSS